MHGDMENLSEIGHEVLTGALSKRAAITKLKIGWHTLKKMLVHDEPPRGVPATLPSTGRGPGRLRGSDDQDICGVPKDRTANNTSACV